MLYKSFVCRPESGPKHFDKLKPESLVSSKVQVRPLLRQRHNAPIGLLWPSEQ